MTSQDQLLTISRGWAGQPKQRAVAGPETADGMYFSGPLGCWVVEGYAQAVAVMREPALEIPRLPLPAHLLTPRQQSALLPLWEQAAHVPLYSAGKEHLRLRRELRDPFTRAAVAAWRPLIRQAASELVEARVPSGHVEVGEDVGRPLLGRVMAQVVGIPERMRTDFGHWADSTVNAGKLATPEWSEQVAVEVAEAVESIVGLVREVLSCPGEIPPGSVMAYAAARRGRPGCLSEQELAANIRSLYTAGAYTTIFLIASAAYLLFADEIVLDEARRTGGVIASVVQETLRFACPAAEVIIRRAARDVAIGKHVIRRGQFVRTVVLRASRDPGRFRDPDVFDHHRPGQRRALAFGVGPHVCLGNHLATAIAEETCGVLADPTYSARLVDPYPRFRRRPAAPVMWGPDWVHLELGPQ
jgi:cytochrome P450